SISGYHMHEAGATAVQELAFTIADGKEYAKRAMATGLDIDTFAGRLSFFFGIGMNFFMEIAKLRAARTLWYEVMDGLGAKSERSKMLRTHCQTSGVSLQEQDPYNNVMRTTIEAMAATLGGTQSLHTNALDEAIALPTDFSARIARNTQLVLQEESGICNVVDPLGGSHYIEALTSKLVEDARALMAEVDEAGGMTAYVGTGAPKAEIERAAAEKQTMIDQGKTVIVGVNKYQPAEEEPIDTLEVDNAKVRKGQIERIAKVRSERDEAACQAALTALSEAAATDPAMARAALGDGRDERGVPLPPSRIAELEAKGDVNLLARAVDAARADATLGEISSAMEQAFGRHDATPKPVSGVYATAYEFDQRWEQVTSGVDAVERRLGRKPRIMVAKMGQDGHDRGANVIASAFADMGFEVVSGPLFQTPQETCATALAKDVDVIGASSLAAGHKTLIPELIRLLKEAGRPDIKVTAGGVIPPQDYDFLREAGVQGIYGPGSNVVECAADILTLLGHNMPPAGEGLDEAAE
ncbi:MAG: methylmalonyl-CoA mutase family protein, partial [Pseudomonadota bacterium]